MRRDICFGAKATPKSTTKMKERWDIRQHDSFTGNKLINSLLTKYPSRFQSRWAAVKFARGLFREGVIKSATNIPNFEDSDQLYTWQLNEHDSKWHKMKPNETNTDYQSHIGRKRNVHEQEDLDIINSVRAALCQPKKNVSMLNKFFKDLQQDFPDTKKFSDKTALDHNLINPRFSTASSESSADAITQSYPKLSERPFGKLNTQIYQMGSNGRNYSSIPEENLQNLDRSHGGSSLEYEMSHDNNMSIRRWQETQFCYSDNEKQLIEEMKKMKRDHNESIQAYEERISKLMAKMHELRGIAEMLENSSTKSSPYGLLPGRANLLNLLNSKPEKKPVNAASAGFVPPPLPPRPGKGGKIYPNKPIIHPKCKMKQLDWSRIILNEGSQNSLASLWHRMTEPKIDFDELERLFRCFGGNSLYDDIVNRRGKSKQQYVTILTSEQSRRLVNTMKILPCDLPTVVDGISAMDYHVVQSDRFVELIELLATCNEVEKVLYHVKRKGAASIDHPEFFIAEISKVDHFKDRLDFMRFKKKVQWHLFEIDQQLRELHTACDEISNSMALKNLLETVLAVGNYMNGGTEEGQADGFTIDALNKLKDTQDQDGKTNLLEFVLKMYCHLYEAEVEISCPTRFRLPEPSNMRHAAQVSFESIQETLENLHGEVKVHRDKVESQFTQNGNNENVVQIRTACDNFHTSALEMITEEERLLNDTKDVYQKTSAYFMYDESPNKPQNFFQIWAVFLHDCKYFWKLAHRRIAKERFELEFRYKGQLSMGASHGFDNFRANMFRHLITLRNNHDFKDQTHYPKQVNNWMESNESNIKLEKAIPLKHSHQIDSPKQTHQRTISPKPFTSDPPDSANVHKPQPVKSGSTPPHYENQNELDKFMLSSKTDNIDEEKSGNIDKTDKSQFSFRSWLKREPGKGHNSGENKSSEEKRVEQTNENIKRQPGETTLSKLRHSVVQKFSGSSSSSKQRTHQALQNANVTTEHSFQNPPSYVPLNLNINDIDPYETSLGRESRFGTLNSEIDLRPKPFDKEALNDSEFQVNSAERRSKFDASKFYYKGIKSRQGSDISTEYASLYHTPPFSSPPVTHIDKDGYASPITLNATSKNDINNNETKLRASGRDVPPRNRAPLALGSNTSISEAYRRTDPIQKETKRLKTDKSDRNFANTVNLPTTSMVHSMNYQKDTPAGRHSRDHFSQFSENRYTTNQSSLETNVKSAYQSGSYGYERNDSMVNNTTLPLNNRPQESLREPPPKPERNLERYAGSQNLSIFPDAAHKESHLFHQGTKFNDQNSNNETRSFLTKKGMNRPPITSLIKRFEQDNEQGSAANKNDLQKQTMLSTSTPLTPRRPMTLHDDDDDDPPPLPPRYDIHATSNKGSAESNQNFSHLSNMKVKNETILKSVHTRENTSVSEQEEGYKDKLRKAANSAVFERYKSQSTPQYNRQAPQYGRQSSNQSQFSQQSSLTPASVSSRPYPRQEEPQFSSPQSSQNIQKVHQQTPQSQTRKPGLGRFGNIHQINSENRSSIHL